MRRIERVYRRIWTCRTGEGRLYYVVGNQGSTVQVYLRRQKTSARFSGGGGRNNQQSPPPAPLSWRLEEALGAKVLRTLVRINVVILLE